MLNIEEIRVDATFKLQEKPSNQESKQKWQLKVEIQSNNTEKYKHQNLKRNMHIYLGIYYFIFYFMNNKI